MRLPLVIRLWFAADLIVALLPELHWAVGDGALFLGAPRVLLYLFGASAFIAASVGAAYASQMRSRA